MNDVTRSGPQGDLSLRVLAMPADTNPSGHIFGGWVLGQMDIAGAIHAIGHAGHAGHSMVTVAVDAMKFHKPVHVGDEVTCYTRIGRTSISVMIETWIRRNRLSAPLHVTEGVFTYVAVDSRGKSVEIENKVVPGTE